ncbi:hypothetical protein ACLXAZ_33500, partial [Escherichia coli]
APSLNLQLFTTQPETHGSLIQAGELWHGMVAITLPPQNLRTFNAPSLNLQLFTTQPETHGSLIQAGELWHGMVAI